MRPPAYIADAFTSRQFAGNPAAVVLVDEKIEALACQKIAAEFNLSETAFPFPTNAGETYKDASSFELRWFTPQIEVPLCGHATLATAHILFNEIGNTSTELSFSTKSGILLVQKSGNGMEMNFPLYSLTSVSRMSTAYKDLFPSFDAPSFFMDLIRCIVPESLDLLSVVYSPDAKMLIAVLNSKTTRQELESFKPDYSRLLSIHPDGSMVMDVILTCSPTDAKEQGFVNELGEAFDYACRDFCPWFGMNEDPATGAVQCALAPFWSAVLGKSRLNACQAFPGRGAEFRLSLTDDGRIDISGHAVTVMSGRLHLN